MEVETNILDLPEDCLLSIFDELPFPNLVEIFKSHKHFRAIATYFVSLRYKTLQIEYSSYYGSYVINGIALDRLVLKKFFEIFGKCFTSITLQPFDYIEADVTEVLSLADRYCGGSVKYLVLNHVSIDKWSVNRLSGLFKHLNGLEIINSLDNGSLENILILCENLKDLLVNHENLQSESFMVKIPLKLERIWYRHSNLDITTEIMQWFLQTHPNLRVVNISNAFSATNECLNHLINVELLHVDMRYPSTIGNLNKVNWSRLIQLKCLKRLELLFDQDISDSLVKVPSGPSTSIEILSVHLNHLKNIFDLFNTFKFINLKILTISYISSDENNHIGFINPSEIKNAIRNSFKLEEAQFYNFPSEALEFVIEIIKASSSLRRMILHGNELNYSDIERLDRMIRIKERELNLRGSLELIIVKNSDDLWHYDYFNGNF